MKIHHIGYLVKSMEKAQKTFTELGYRIEQETVYDDYRQIDICFLEKDGYRIELVCPGTATSVVANLRKKIGNAPYHICYETDDLEKAVEELKQKRFVICEEPHAAPALKDRRVVFLVHGQMGMIELLEK
ncbi:MAG: lactoylglutathione lyase [Lachnospiraceae bacterium]|nr:lactoylglutathione lyase [Lachnospiraceae bacterium]